MKLFEIIPNSKRLGRGKELGFDTSTVFYHGTPFGGFDKFSKKHFNNNTKGSKGSRDGFFFTRNPDIADTYSRRVDVDSANAYEDMFGEPPKSSKTLPSPTSYPVYLKLGKSYITTNNITASTISTAKDEGYNSIILKHPTHSIDNEYVVFEPNQIKSINAKFKSKNSSDLLETF